MRIRFFARELNVSSNFAVASMNTYIPIISMQNGEVYKKGDKREFKYSLDSIGEGYVRGTVKYNLFIQAFKFRYAYSQDWYTLTKAGVTERYLATEGTLLWQTREKEIKPLMLLCLKNNKLYSVDRENPNPNDFCLVIDKSFMKNEVHSLPYKSIRRLYIDEVAKEIDIVYTNNIMEVCYKSPLELPKFKTIMEMMNHFNSINRVDEIPINIKDEKEEEKPSYKPGSLNMGDVLRAQEALAESINMDFGDVADMPSASYTVTTTATDSVEPTYIPMPIEPEQTEIPF